MKNRVYIKSKRFIEAWEDFKRRKNYSSDEKLRTFIGISTQPYVTAVKDGYITIKTKEKFEKAGMTTTNFITSKKHG